ncbi:MAG TPA: L,D-transpeptidase family protein [Pyrinomonadaceae bacterium]|nr:L,D-transpeptidase family protein [Pyrinomonadaceae bacterium]
MCTSKRLSVTVATLSVLLFTATASFASTTNKRKGAAPSRALTRSEALDAEARLAEMGYPTGRVDGVVDGTTRSGLILFQKWEGRKITGRLSRAEAEAILAATAPAPKDPGYKHVEVDVDRQVLLLIDDEGKIKRMLPVSTGSNRRYKEKRMSGLAYTPRGRFRIYSKLSGWRKSPLGLLYYPNYFSDGLAIHGNPSVPHSPQSHGCIRIPMSAAASVSRALPIGTIVLIYDSQGFVSAKDWAEADKQKQEAIR